MHFLKNIGVNEPLIKPGHWEMHLKVEKEQQNRSSCFR